MTNRERQIAALALSNLERTIASFPTKMIRWTPPLTVSEVARLRRQLTSQDVLVADVVG